MTPAQYALFAYLFGFAVLVLYLLTLWIEAASVARREKLVTRSDAAEPPSTDPRR